MYTVSEALAEAAQKEPDLAAYYELHRALLELLEEARGEIKATLEMADEEALQGRVLQGLPLVSFAQLPIEAERFARLAAEIAPVLTDYNVDVGDRTLPATAAGWVSLAQQRFEEGKMTGEQSGEPEEATLAQMVTDLALKPYLEWAAEQVLPYVDQERWRRGYCPVCGGAPDFATLGEEAGARHMLCSRCSSQWLYRRLGCPFCGNTDHTRLAYYPSEDGVHRLYVCRECRRYLKAIDLRKAGRTVLLPVERVTTVAMDAAAVQEGYR
jgi:FdhE protein